jgi:PAS domain-containing protein
MRTDEKADEGKGPWGETSASDRLALSRTLLSMMKDGVFFADRELRVRYANPAFSMAACLDTYELEAPTR